MENPHIFLLPPARLCRGGTLRKGSACHSRFFLKPSLSETRQKSPKYVPCLRMDAALWDIVLHRKEKFLKEIVIPRRPCRKTTFFSFVARHRFCMLLLVEFQRRKIIFRARREKGFSCIYPRKRKISLLRASRFGWRSARLYPRPSRSRRKRQLKLSRQPRFLRRMTKYILKRTKVRPSARANRGAKALAILSPVGNLSAQTSEVPRPAVCRMERTER